MSGVRSLVAAVSTIAAMLVGGLIGSQGLAANNAGGVSAAKGAETTLSSWNEAFVLPAADKRSLLGIWAAEDGAVCAVGNRVIVQGRVGGRFDTTDLSEDQELYDVWGRDADDLIAVGGRQLIMRFANKKWSTERPIQTGNPRQLLLYSVGPFLPGTIVAYGPGPSGLKRTQDGWQPLTGGDLEALRRRDLVSDPWNKPCRSGARGRGATREGEGWAVCADRSTFLKRNQVFEPRGRAPSRCLSGQPVYGAAVWHNDLFLLCDGEVWRNHDTEWQRERTPEKARALFSRPDCIYAVGKRSIMVRCK